ncbi:thymidylate kinase [Paraglaciecola sp. T6c]|uniref:dTMP kinase n=1 Tax=Pseudoalteromonas atlantica (strain T6c / ATCC BAA-1087) TaxID=3042615 RepID=UPI00005C584B|nr:dTMP kinase [Paraglaciecola sp. T6c]ABG40635.1 thymidylate kinase [Paraglaciecola sp. T6c]
MIHPGKFIVIEGLEGAGKSTAVSIVKSCIEQAGHSLTCTREPGGTAMAEAIRECVKKDWPNETVTTEAELLLMYAARAQLLHNVIHPALTSGSWVLGDRHDMSSQAYQGGGREIPQTLIQPLRDITLKGFVPDFTLYLDVEPSIGLARARGRGELDRIEQLDISFFERTRARYLSLAEQDENCVVIDTMQSIEQVHHDIQHAMQQFLAV